MRAEVTFYTNSSCMINDQNNRKSAEKACWVYTCKGSLYYHLDCESNIRQMIEMPCWMRQNADRLTQPWLSSWNPLCEWTDQRIHLQCAFTETMTTHVLINTGFTTVTTAHIQILPSLLRHCSLRWRHQSWSGRSSRYEWFLQEKIK